MPGLVPRTEEQPASQFQDPDQSPIRVPGLELLQADTHWQGDFPAEGRVGMWEALPFLGGGCILIQLHGCQGCDIRGCGLCFHSAPYCQFGPMLPTITPLSLWGRGGGLGL